MTYLTFLHFFDSSVLPGLSASFFKLLQIFQKLSNIFIEKNVCLSRPAQFKSVLFKGQLYYNMERGAGKRKELLQLSHEYRPDGFAGSQNK